MMVDHFSTESSDSFYLNRREMIPRTAATGLALGTVTFSSKYADAKGVEQSTPQRKPIFKSLKFGMIREDLSILGKFNLVQDIG